MKYEKPEMVDLGAATEVVQSLAKQGDNRDCLDQPTASTYEADE
jgi:hypothetical protein